jgi:hypothetical protein
MVFFDKFPLTMLQSLKNYYPLTATVKAIKLSATQIFFKENKSNSMAFHPLFFREFKNPLNFSRMAMTLMIKKHKKKFQNILTI